MKKKIALGVIMVLCILSAFIFSRRASAPTYEVKQPSASQPQPESSFNKQTHSITETGSIWWIVSKVSPINPADYAPDDLIAPGIPLRTSNGDSEMRLRKETAEAMETMFADAKKDGINLMLASGYRSYRLQISVYNANVQKYGQAGADKQSARPGTSEHQTGLAADLEPVSRECEVETCFGDLAEGKWVAANAYKYGFVIRYPLSKEKVTGYEYEPWHVRYVGTDLSNEMHQTGIATLEEFFNVVPASQPY